jgi:phosphoribosyl 1,2-cyclic phosphate phosphodiesterase
VKVRFLGTGTSHGIPVIGCTCPVCTSPDPRDKRTRPSVAISYGPTTVLVDTTPELRLQSVAHGLNRVDAVVFTHAHADHLMGLDDVRRFNAIKKGPLDVWAEPHTHDTIRSCFGYAFRVPNPDAKVFRPHLIPRDITGPFDINGVTWTPVRLYHGDMRVLGFRVGNLAYCTDVSNIPDESYDLLQNLDVLVLDALQWQGHPTHFNVPQAIAASRRIRPKRTYFTHIAHGLPASDQSKLPESFELAHDGLRITASL